MLQKVYHSCYNSDLIIEYEHSLINSPANAFLKIIVLTLQSEEKLSPKFNTGVLSS